MKVDKSYTVMIDDEDMNDLLSVLYYTAGKATYPAGAPQHELLRDRASRLHSDLSFAIGDA